MSPKLAAASARLVPKKSAGVAVIFREGQDDEDVLLIRRAEREGDTVVRPGGISWRDGEPGRQELRGHGEEGGRGGGRRRPRPAAPRSSAGTCANSGRGRRRSSSSRPSSSSSHPSTYPEPEVASYDWASLGELAGEEARSSYLIPRSGDEIRSPASCTTVSSSGG